ncbi:MAG: adenosylcobinamide amidohydrolase [Candidatus Syntropharchaeia archaeon]
MWDIRIEEDAVIVSSKEEFPCLSSAILNGGYARVRSIVNLRVQEDYRNPDPEKDLISFSERMGLRKPVVGMMTAADMKNAVLMEEGYVKAITTAGFSRRTINIILLVEGDLTQGCMANGIITATEAKTSALIDLDVREDGFQMTGTPTDSIAIACDGKGKKHVYAGSATDLGKKIGNLVRRSVKEALQLQEGIKAKREVIKRLEERGIKLKDLVKCGMELYVGSDETYEEVEKKLEDALKKALGDVNVESLVLAALKLDEEVESGRIHGLNHPDPVYLLADELIGIDIAEYIAGSRALFNFARYDQKKPHILKELGPFSDDAMGGLVAGVMTLILG